MLKLLQMLLTLLGQFQWRLQPRNQEKDETQKASKGRIRKDHREQRYVLRGQNHTLVFPIPMYRCESRTVKKVDQKKKKQKKNQIH